MSLIVIKYGGSLLEDPSHRSAFLKDVATLGKTTKIILVHGGGKEISRQMEKSGLKPVFVEGRRFTDEATMKVVERTLQALNDSIVSELRSYGVHAEGFSGRYEHFLLAQAIPELGRVGSPIKVHEETLKVLLDRPLTPVFYSVAEDDTGAPLNINADDFAQIVAIAARADKLVFITDSGGIRNANGFMIAHMKPTDVETFIADDVITGGMIVKARACVEAVESGVGSVHIVSNIKHLKIGGDWSLQGTVFTKTEGPDHGKPEHGY